MFCNQIISFSFKHLSFQIAYLDLDTVRKNGTHRIGVVAMGTVPDRTLKVIAAHVSGYLALPAEVLPPLGHPSYALDKRRLQYNAGLILGRLEAEPLTTIDKVVGVLQVDLFVPIFTHVFGEARQGGKAALVSLYRLGGYAGESDADSPMALERAAKVALHELCHLYRLAHCQDSKCLMHFSGDLAELDRTPFYFCRYCTAFFRDAVKACPF